MLQETEIGTFLFFNLSMFLYVASNDPFTWVIVSCVAGRQLYRDVLTNDIFSFFINSISLSFSINIFENRYTIKPFRLAAATISLQFECKSGSPPVITARTKEEFLSSSNIVTKFSTGIVLPFSS